MYGSRTHPSPLPPPLTRRDGGPLVGLALVGVLLLSGCGGGNSSTATPSATPESTLQTACLLYTSPSPRDS